MSQRTYTDSYITELEARAFKNQQAIKDIETKIYGLRKEQHDDKSMISAFQAHGVPPPSSTASSNTESFRTPLVSSVASSKDTSPTSITGIDSRPSLRIPPALKHSHLRPSDREKITPTARQNLRISFGVRGERGEVLDVPAEDMDLAFVLRESLRRKGWGKERIEYAVGEWLRAPMVRVGQRELEQ